MTSPSSWHKANDAEDGPFRAVDRVVEGVSGPFVCRWEVLVCGHRGRMLDKWSASSGPSRYQQEFPRQPAKRRRCWSCRTP